MCDILALNAKLFLPAMIAVCFWRVSTRKIDKMINSSWFNFFVVIHNHVRGEGPRKKIIGKGTIMIRNLLNNYDSFLIILKYKLKL